MKTVIGIALAVVALLTALSAFGGKTWNEGTEALYKRITGRGWVALGCFIATCVLGMVNAALDPSPTALPASPAELQKLDLLASQAKALAAGRRDELRRDISTLDDSLLHIQSAIHVYSGLRNTQFAVTPRAPRAENPTPSAPNLTAAVHDFLLIACDPALQPNAPVESRRDCPNNSTFRQIPQVKDTGLDTSPYGWSFVALLQDQMMIYQADRELLNGPLIPGQDPRSEIELNAVLPQWTHDCNVRPKLLHRATDLARTLRALARSSAQLHHLFQFGYPTQTPQLLQFNENEFSQAMALYSINVVALDKMVAPAQSSDDEAAYRMGRLTENLATGYRELFADLQTMLSSCQESKKQLEAEVHDVLGR